MSEVKSAHNVDIHYPELFSKRHSLEMVEFPLKHKRDLRKARNKSRYRTQPITFDEIQEVDEEKEENRRDLVEFARNNKKKT